MSYDDLDADDFDDEDEYEDALEELERAEQEDEERRSRGGLRKHWRDLTGASIFPGGFPDGLPDPEWPTGLSDVANPDAWRAGSDGPADMGWTPGPDGPVWPKL